MMCWNSGQGLGGLGFRVDGLGFGVTKHPLETHSRNPKEDTTLWKSSPTSVLSPPPRGA